MRAKTRKGRIHNVEGEPLSEVQPRPDWDKLLPRKEVADMIGVKPGTLEVWESTKRHGLPCVKSGGRAMYWKSDVLRWLASRTSNQDKPATG